MPPSLVLVRLTAKDQKNIALIIGQVEGVDTPAEALLWAVQKVIADSQNPPSGNPPPDAPTRSGGLPRGIFDQTPIRRRPTPLADIRIGDAAPAIEIKLNDLITCGITSHVTVDAYDLVKFGVKPKLVEGMFSSAVKGRGLSGGVSILRASTGALKK